MTIENEMGTKEYQKLAKKLEREKWNIAFAKQLDALEWKYKREYRFHADRDWRFDFLIPHPIQVIEPHSIQPVPLAVLVDIQGGTWSGGAHVRGKGYQNDVDKMNAATSMGWSVYWFTSEDVETGKAIKFLKEEIWK